MFQATRRRLAIWYTAVTAVLLLVFAVGFYVYVRSTLVERVDDTLKHVVEVVERSLVIESVSGSPATDFDAQLEGELFRVNVEASFRNNANTTDDDHIDLEWFSPTGDLLWSTLEQSLNIPLHLNLRGETVRLREDQLLRQITQRVQVGRQVLGYLRVSHPWFEVTTPIRRLILDLALGLTLMVGTVAAVGWFLSGLAMTPVRESYQRLKQFTADASHELRNPIAVIQTNVQVALTDPHPDPEFMHDQLLVVERITRRLGRLVDDLLFLARQDSGAVQLKVPVSIYGLLEDIVNEQQAIAIDNAVELTFEPHLLFSELEHSDLESTDSDESRQSQSETISTDIDSADIEPADLAQAAPGQSTSVSTAAERLSFQTSRLASPLCLVQGDAEQLRRLFTNLISNAIHYTPAQGWVRVSIEQLPLNLGIGVHGTVDGVKVKVCDSGVGISPDDLPHIIDRFYRADRARTTLRSLRTASSAGSTETGATGAGLGLAIAKVIVDSHRGQLHVDSQLGEGTTFEVFLPGASGGNAELSAPD
ncbi:MAG: HAMP domain-containing sensor histidine kinase [Elainellaceae cyanobacterium]